MKITKQQKESVPFQYAYDVLEGKIVVGKRIKQSVERFFDWIENCPEGDYLDHEKGMRMINFFPKFLNHTKGIPAGKPFHLAPFQQFNKYNIYGWQTPWLDENKKPHLDANGNPIYIRRIRKVYDKRARGNGKTAEMAGDSIGMASVEMESEAEVYICATKESQAKVCWKFAKNYIQHPFANPIMKQLPFQCKQREIIFKPLDSKIEALGNNPDTQDALAASFAIIDEYHAHVSDELLEVIESSMLKRREPLTYIITTAGFNLSGVCFQFEQVCKNILDGNAKNDSIYISIHELDEGDDWEDQSNWIKANPLWGNGLNVAEIVSAYKETVNQPSKIPNFKTKHLNMWVDALTVWVPSEIWEKGNIPIKEENFKKHGCTGALDLSSTTDFTAFANISEEDEEGYRDLKVYLFCPKETIKKRAKEDKVPYQQWVDEGYIIATEGNIVDYKVLEDIVISEYSKHAMKWVEYDSKFSEQLVQNLMEENIKLSPFSQTLMNYSNPTKQLERLLYGGKIRHGGNPVLKWMLAGCMAISDTNENIRISKKHSTRRIDGIIATIMALGGSLTPDEETNESQYNNPENEISFGVDVDDEGYMRIKN